MGFLGAMLGIFGCKQPKTDDQWTVATGDDNGSPFIVRTRLSIPAGIETTLYSNLMAITWKYAPETNGMPSRVENQRMEELENLIEGGIEKPKHAVMTAAVTCNGIREWQLYAKDETAFMIAFNKTVAGRPIYPIEIAHQVDPGWTAWKKFTEAVKK